MGTGSLCDVRLIHEDGRDLVEKRLLPRFRREPEARASLVREAQVLAAVRHPSLPELVRVGTDDKGPFLVETFIHGTSVRRLVDIWAHRGGVPARLAAHVARQAFWALSEISTLEGPHGPLAFVHGDIGPDHVLLGPAGEVRFIDFGASRIASLSPALLGEGRGTLPFVAPEVARGEVPPDAGNDVYALAATTLFLVATEPICRTKDEAAMLFEVGTSGVRTELFERTAAFRDREREVLTHALAVDPAARLTSASAVLGAFDS